MSPAGYWPQLRAAIETGADAVYFGLDHFSARAKVGFRQEELPDVINALHERGVMGFVTFNTLVFDDELAKAEKAIIAIANSGADAIIVQDFGIAGLVREIAPDLDIHGSTQMSITSAQGAEFARRLGCSRVVLGRELSLKDIGRIREATDLELEVFVHGALCVSYSGQCFSSEAWGGRSANRGKCAQACRLSYDLIVDGHYRELGPDRYLLSPGDLYAIDQIPELVRLGISCVKIEGRYKDENYVALTTAAYRKAIDSAANALMEESALPADHQIELSDANPDLTVSKTELEQIYSRGLGPHFMAGVNHQSVVRARAPRHRGLQVATVTEVGRQSVIVQFEHELRPGDGVVFDAAEWRSPDEPEEGGNIYHVTSTGKNQQELQFGTDAVDFTRIREGDLVWRTSDPKLLVQLKPLARPKSISYTRPVNVRVEASAGEKLKVVATIENGISVNVESESSLTPASKHGLDEQRLRQQLGRLGETPFHLAGLTLETDADVPLFLPVSQLNDVRRTTVEQLLQRRTASGKFRTINDGVVHRWLNERASSQFQPSDADAADTNATTKEARLHVLVRTAEQLDAAIRCSPDSITLDYLELYGLRPSVEKIKSAGINARVASPRILKPAEQNVVRFLISLDCDIVVRSAGLLHDLLQIKKTTLPPLVGDFSLNAANAITAQDFLEKGLLRITPTYDLNARQVENLCRRIAPQHLEVIAYSHLPVFHTEHCVFCRFMSDGTDNTNCGHPCEKHQVSLRDQSGRMHPVMADVGCRNTVFGAEAQVVPQAISRWQAAGLSHFRIEFVHESPDVVEKIARVFLSALKGEITFDRMESELQSLSPAGITEGSLYVP